MRITWILHSNSIFLFILAPHRWFPTSHFLVIQTDPKAYTQKLCIPFTMQITFSHQKILPALLLWFHSTRYQLQPCNSPAFHKLHSQYNSNKKRDKITIWTSPFYDLQKSKTNTKSENSFPSFFSNSHYMISAATPQFSRFSQTAASMESKTNTKSKSENFFPIHFSYDFTKHDISCNPVCKLHSQ